MKFFNFLLFYYLLNNDLDKNIELLDYLIEIINDNKNDNSKWKSLLSNLFKIILHKRQYKNDNLTNNNSKNIFYRSIIKLYDHYPKYIDNMILNDVFSSFGYYKDYIKIWELLYYDLKKKYDLTDNSNIDIFYKKYNNLIVNISYVLIKKKNDEMNQLDDFIKQFSFFDIVFTQGIDYFLNLPNSFKIQTITSFIRNYNTDYYCITHYFKQLKLSKLSQWLPRENKFEATNIFWYKKINDSYKKFNCYDYLVLVDKILFKNKNSLKITSYDKKLFRKETSVLNICLENPNTFLCNNMKEYIDFYKCGSKFIKNNINHILFKNNNKLLLNTKIIYNDIINNLDTLYDINNINICKFNLSNYLKLKIKKKQSNPLLDKNINIQNYQELLNDNINNILNHNDYKSIEIL